MTRSELWGQLRRARYGHRDPLNVPNWPLSSAQCVANSRSRSHSLAIAASLASSIHGRRDQIAPKRSLHPELLCGLAPPASIRDDEQPAISDISRVTTPVILSWSGGKESALALHALSQDTAVSVVGLLTTITAEYDRVSIHGVRRSLLRAQATRLGFPLFESRLKPASSNAEYEAAFHASLSEIRRAQPAVAHIAFGDLFLEDVRAYRERLLADSGWTPLFPIWGQDTSALARRFIDDGFAARLVCVDTTQLDPAFAGRSFDTELLADLPKVVDPCGERGEFHTFVSDGPMFGEAIPYECGERVLRDGRFMYCDLLDKAT